MRKWWKVGGSVLFVLLGVIRGIVDAIGEVQTASDLPVQKWLMGRYFPLAAFAAATLLGAWAYYDYRIKKEPAGFVGTPENKRRFRKQGIVGALAVLAVCVFTPLIYSHYRHAASKSVTTTSNSFSFQNGTSASDKPTTPQPLSNLQAAAPKQQTGKGSISAAIQKPAQPKKQLHSAAKDPVKPTVRSPAQGSSFSGVYCGKVDHLPEGMTSNCQDIEVSDNHFGGVTSLLENAGKTERVAFSGVHIVTPKNGDVKLVNTLPGGDTKDVTAEDVTVGPAAASAPPISSAVADQLSQLIDVGRDIMGAFMKDDNAQSLADKESKWEADVQAVLRVNLGQSVVDQFHAAQSTTTTYAEGRSTQGGSIYNLMDAKIVVLSRIMNQLRAAASQHFVYCGSFASKFGV